MNSSSNRSWIVKAGAWSVIGAAMIVIIACTLNGCSRQADKSALSAGTVAQTSQVLAQLPGYAGDGPYAVVKADALPTYYDSFRKRLFDDGVVKWDERFDCNHFASYYVALAQTQFYLANWGASTPAQTLALAEVWYRPGGGAKGHAIVAAYTDKGLLYIEPQTGRTIALSTAERASTFLVKW